MIESKKGRPKGSKNLAADYPCDCGCGKLVKPHYPSLAKRGYKKRYFSRECYYRGQRKNRVEVKCRCGRSRWLLQSQIDKGLGKHCSKRCQYAPSHQVVCAVCFTLFDSLQAIARGQKDDIYYCSMLCLRIVIPDLRTAILLRCASATCRRFFKIEPRKLRTDRDEFFCSPMCYYGHPDYEQISHRVELQCANCSKSFTRARSNAEAEHPCCSPVCTQAYQY